MHENIVETARVRKQLVEVELGTFDESHPVYVYICVGIVIFIIFRVFLFVPAVGAPFSDVPIYIAQNDARTRRFAKSSLYTRARVYITIIILR